MQELQNAHHIYGVLNHRCHNLLRVTYEYLNCWTTLLHLSFLT